MISAAAYYLKKLKLSSADWSLIEHNEAICATVLRISPPEGEELILKICARQGEFWRESYFLSLLYSKIPVPKLLQTVEPTEGFEGAILMERIEGDLASDICWSPAFARQVATALARLHAEPCQAYGDVTQPSGCSSDPRIPFAQKFAEGIAECRGHLPEASLQKAQCLFDQQLDALLTADGPCLIHRDFRPGNLITGQNQLLAIIDWSSARGGFAEEDFLSLPLQEWSSEVREAFLQGYARSRLLPDFEQLRPLLSLSRAIAAIGFTVRQGSWQTRDQLLYQRYCQLLSSYLT